MNDQKKINWPVNPYTLTDEHWKFGDKVPRRLGLRAIHLGDDIVLPSGSVVMAIGKGIVIFSDILVGSESHRSWGGLVIIEHQDILLSSKFNFSKFYSIYGHMQDLQVEVGDHIEGGKEIGVIADSYTPENGWWKIAHLHFAIYVGPWQGKILPGYWRPESWWRTKVAWWINPRDFIEESL